MKYKKQKTKYFKENNPHWKGGIPNCIDCYKELSNHDHKRCKKCFNLSIRGKKITKKHKDKISKANKGKNNKQFKHGKYCKDKTYYCKCGQKLSNYTAKRCHKCANKIITRMKSRNDKMKKTLIKHHIYLKENNDKILILNRSKHTQLHNRVYEYLYIKEGKKGINNYIKWFDKKYGLK